MDSGVRDVFNSDEPRTPESVLQEATRCAIECAQKSGCDPEDTMKIEKLLTELDQVQQVNDDIKDHQKEIVEMLRSLIGQKGT